MSNKTSTKQGFTEWQKVAHIKGSETEKETIILVRVQKKTYRLQVQAIHPIKKESNDTERKS